MKTVETAMPYCFVGIDDGIVNMHELLAVVKEKDGGTVLLFKNGHRLPVEDSVKDQLSKVLDLG